MRTGDAPPPSRYNAGMADKDSRVGARHASAEIIDYLNRVHAPHDEALARAFDAPEREGMPAIQLGPSEGRLLSILLRLAGAQKVVEVGTLAGYSALWIARALPEGGRLWTIEKEPRHAEVARENIARAGLASKVEIVVDDGLAGLARIEPEGPFCAVFVDADKGRYDAYGRWARAHLRKGGLLIGDNAYYFGKLADEGDPAAAAMRRFHEEMAEAFESVCAPTPDGLAIGIKS
jgi:predicted O-methyltransferase YrrM